MDRPVKTSPARRRASLAAAVVRGLVVVGIAVGIWYPEATHDDIDGGRVDITRSIVQAARQAPDDAVLREIGDMTLGVILVPDPPAAVRAADAILAGSLPDEWVAETLPLTGYPADDLVGSSTQQLAIAGLEIERILLVAYAQTGDRRYLDRATDRTLQFAAYEATQRRNRTFLWNDHATSARIALLVRLWAAVRARSDVTEEQQRVLLALVERSGLRLAKPQLFTVRTNHGVMQNLALLQIAAAFPALPEAAGWRALALERLRVQMRYYVADEGFVLEHSAEYHLMGTELTADAVRLCVLNGMEPPSWLAEASRNSARVLDRLMRPDGSLPIFGNTNGGSGRARPSAAAGGTAPVRFVATPFATPAAGADLFPLSGYALWWQGNAAQAASQTVVAWAKHDGHGHKHADEGSVLWWSDGVDWLTNTGYWPYGLKNEPAAYSWSASNALHQADETFVTPRATTLLASAADDERRFVDLARRDADGRTFRREVLQLTPRTLLVMDFATGATGDVETFWTIDPALRWSTGSEGDTFVSTAAKDGRRISLGYAASAALGATIVRASDQPFAGWVVRQGRPLAADALRLKTSGASGVRAQIFQLLDQESRSPSTVALAPQADGNRWAVVVRGVEPFAVTRDGDVITIEGPPGNGGPGTRMSLEKPADLTVRSAALQDAYATAVAMYPPWRELGSYRERILLAVGVLFVLTEGLMILSALAGGAALARPAWLRAFVDVATIAAWLALAAWIFLRYLVP